MAVYFAGAHCTLLRVKFNSCFGMHKTKTPQTHRLRLRDFICMDLLCICLRCCARLIWHRGYLYPPYQKNRPLSFARQFRRFEVRTAHPHPHGFPTKYNLSCAARCSRPAFRISSLHPRLQFAGGGLAISAFSFHHYYGENRPFKNTGRKKRLGFLKNLRRYRKVDIRFSFP